jgi:hypothetical protein
MSWEKYYTESDAWFDKGRRWLKVSMVFMVWAILAVPVQFAVDDDFWSIVVLIGMTGVGLVGQICSIIRMLYCYRRANRS